MLYLMKCFCGAWCDSLSPNKTLRNSELSCARKEESTFRDYSLSIRDLIELPLCVRDAVAQLARASFSPTVLYQCSRTAEMSMG